MLQRGLVCIIKTSFQKASRPMKHCFFTRYRRGISEAHFCALWRQALPGMPAMLGPGSAKRCKYCQKLLCSALGCCSVRFGFAVAGSRAARSLLFSRWFSGLLARARATPATKRCYLRCFVAFAFPGWLAGCSFWAALSGVSGARARATPCQPSALGPRWGPESWHPRHHLGLGWATCITGPRFSYKKNDMTHNFKEA